MPSSKWIVTGTKAEELAAIPGGDHAAAGGFNPGYQSNFLNVAFGVVGFPNCNIVGSGSRELLPITDFTFNRILLALDQPVILVVG